MRRKQFSQPLHQGSHWKFFWVAYEKIKIKASKDVGVRMNLGFVHWFEVFPKSSWNSSSKYWNSEGWKPSPRVFGSGEGLWMGDMCLDLAEETSSWLDSGSARRGLLESEFSRLWSRSASPSAKVLWSKDPPVMISSYRADSLLRLDQKCYNSIWSSIDKARLECAQIGNSSPACNYGFLLMFAGAENLLS